jgi:glyoxylate/hydroxypyruvate reductase A
MTGIVFTDDAAHSYAQAISTLAPDISLWSIDDPDAVNADVAVSWVPKPGIYRRFPQLRLIHSIGAGANAIALDGSGSHLPICRIVDPEQALSMAHYIVWGVLEFHRDMDALRVAQSKKQWRRTVPRSLDQTVVGIMGMGVMGRAAATAIVQLGFCVRGLSRTGSTIPGIPCYSEREMDSFLAGVDIVVCLLPLTASTRGILSRSLFSRLNRGAKLIHVGRGEHLVEADLLAALECGHLDGAMVDVFLHEPLRSDNPFWTNDKIIVTPHIAALSSKETVAAQIVSNVRALRAGHALSNQVQRDLGY